jgi:hypothetical protein
MIGEVQSIAVEALGWARWSMLTAFVSLILNVVVLLWLLMRTSE